MEDIDEEKYRRQSAKQIEHKHVSKSQGAAELCVQLIMTIYEDLNAKGDITQGYLR